MGHVFVLPGDITQLAVDAWLLPTDRCLRIEPHWHRVEGLLDAVNALGDAAEPFRREEVLALPLPRWPDGAPLPVLVPVPYHGVTHAAQIRRPLREALTSAADAAKRRRVTKRQHPLIATPSFATAGGAGDPVRGELIDVLYEEASTVAAARAVDVAVVLRRAPDLAHLQLQRRGTGTWAALAPEAVTAAADLATRADLGQLVPFLGAGVSASAGLPTWTELLDDLAVEAGFDRAQLTELQRLNLLDRAHILRNRLSRDGDRRRFNQLVATSCTRPRPAPSTGN